MKTLFAGFFVSLSLLAPVVAHAQKEPAQADIDAAKILFDQAQIAYNAENWSVALESYQKAYSIAKKPTILFNIGQCHRKMNHPKIVKKQ